MGLLQPHAAQEQFVDMLQTLRVYGETRTGPYSFQCDDAEDLFKEMFCLLIETHYDGAFDADYMANVNKYYVKCKDGSCIRLGAFVPFLDQSEDEDEGWRLNCNGLVRNLKIRKLL